MVYRCAFKDIRIKYIKDLHSQLSSGLTERTDRSAVQGPHGGTFCARIRKDACTSLLLCCRKIYKEAREVLYWEARLYISYSMDQNCQPCLTSDIVVSKVVI